MAIFKPEMKSSGGGNKFMGVCEMGISSFVDKSAEFDWCDLLLEAEVHLKDSEYPKRLAIKGDYEKDAEGNINGGYVLNRMYRFFEAIGCTAGINLKGEFETSEGDVIPDIAQYLNDNHTSSGIPGTTPELTHVGYVYKRQNTKTKKVYTEVYTRLYPNTEKGKTELEEYIKWMKTNNYLKEYTEVGGDKDGDGVTVTAEADSNF